jgi:hypothetical protein
VEVNMKKRIFCMALWLGIAAGGWAQSLNLKVGLLYPSQNSDLWQINRENLATTKSDLLNAYYAAEYETPVGRYATVAIEVGSYSRTRHTEYRDYEHTDGTPVYQNFSLRLTPIEGTLRIYPNGHRRDFCPYLGLSAAVYAWTFEQWGEFINMQTGQVTEGNAITRTFAAGFAARAGILLRMQRNIGLTVEGKYNYAKGQLSGDFDGFELFDLSGFTGTVGLNFYFN